METVPLSPARFVDSPFITDKGIARFKPFVEEVAVRGASAPRAALSPRLRRAGTFVAVYFAGSFNTEVGAASKTAYILRERTPMTDIYGCGICYQYVAGESKITVNGKPVTISSSREFRDVIRESIFVVGRGTPAGRRVRWLPVRGELVAISRPLLLLPLLTLTK
jgi:hypothetical protein